MPQLVKWAINNDVLIFIVCLIIIVLRLFYSRVRRWFPETRPLTLEKVPPSASLPVTIFLEKMLGRVMILLSTVGAGLLILGKMLGRKMILLSAMGAGLSMLMNWVEFPFFNQTGITIGMSILLLAWLYPTVVAKMRWRIHPRIAYICVGISLIAGLVFLAKTIDAILFFNVTGIGVYVYLASSVTYGFGVILYSRHQIKAGVPHAHLESSIGTDAKQVSG